MERPIIIKGKHIGEGKPIICVPVMGKTKNEIVESIKKMVNDKCEMIEWRVDAFEECNSVNALKAVIEEVAPLLKDTLFVYTYRTKRQGGLGELPEDVVADIRLAAAETGLVDFIDGEYFMIDHPRKIIKELKKFDVHIIASHHDFNDTPGNRIINSILEKMNDSGADVVKLAVMPQTMDDVMNLLIETNDFHNRYPKKPLITMSMGKLGSVSRVIGEYVGSCVTFGAKEVASAPGQLEYSELNQVLNILHKAVE